MTNATAPGEAVSLALQEVARAEVVAFGGVGFASRVLPVTAAYRTLDAALARDGHALRSRLDWLLANASPAGRVYAAVLLDGLDPDAARAAWQRLARDRSEITTFVGCVMNRTTLADYAADRLAGWVDR